MLGFGLRAKWSSTRRSNSPYLWFSKARLALYWRRAARSSWPRALPLRPWQFAHSTIMFSNLCWWTRAQSSMWSMVKGAAARHVGTAHRYPASIMRARSSGRGIAGRPSGMAQSLSTGVPVERSWVMPARRRTWRTPDALAWQPWAGWIACAAVGCCEDSSSRR